MNTRTFIAIVVVLIAVVGAVIFLAQRISPNPQTSGGGEFVSQEPEHIQSTMQLTSPAFENGRAIPAKYTCDGENISTPLKIDDVPSNTATLAIVMDDPDAVKPAGKVWDHWIVWNIPVDTTDIPEGTEPEGVHGKGTGGNVEYSGPCPPDTEHKYRFTLYALDAELMLPAGSTKTDLENMMDGHILEQVTLTGTYKR